MEFVYSFAVWPDERKGFDPAVFDLFRMLQGRVEMRFTEEQFNRFRAGLARHGLTLREVERVPYMEPEAVR
jgi:hypothetical protein